MATAQTDRRRAKVDAQLAYEEAREELAVLVVQMHSIGDRARKIASIAREIEVDAADLLRSESGLFSLTAADFEGIDAKTVRELAISLVEARKELAGKKALALAMNCTL